MQNIIHIGRRADTTDSNALGSMLNPQFKKFKVQKALMILIISLFF